jgi:cobalt-zinc-cadmium resistance protein CzcA
MLLSIVLAIGGWVSFRHLPIDVVPDITNVQVQVNTSVEGLVPAEIERFVTFPIESAMGGLPNVKEVRSISRFGLSQVTTIFEEGTGIYLARQLVAERLQSIRDTLPKGVDPKLGPISTGLGEIFFYALDAKERAKGEARVEQLMELRTIQEWVIKPRLLKLSGIAGINTIGGYEKQFYVHPRIELLAEYGLHLDNIVHALEQNNRNTGGGYIEQTAEQILVQAEGIITSVEDIREVPVKRLPMFKTINVGDVADVKLAKELRTGAAMLNGEEIVLGTTFMLLGENSRTVSERVSVAVEDIKKSLPEWVELKVLYNRSDLVDSTLETVKENLIIGAILVVVVLMLLVGNVRVAVITSITIPLAMLGTFILMKYFNISGNLMSLGALDFGIIIDGAVIVIDNCVREIQKRSADLNRKLSRSEIKQAVIDGTITIRKAAGFGQLIIVIVFLPIFALEGVEGKMFVPMATTFCFALLVGFILSFTTVPALAGMFLPGRFADKKPIVMRFFEHLYRPILNFAIKLRYPVLAAVAVSIGIGFYLFSKSGSEFLPQLDEGSIAIQFVRPPDISVEQSLALEKHSHELLLEFGEVDKVFSRMGTAEVATDPMGINLTDSFVGLKPENQWPEIEGEKRSKEELIIAMKERLELEIPGQRVIFSQPIQLRFNELLEGVRADVAMKIFGPEIETLAELAGKASSIIRGVDGAGDVEEEIKGKSPLLRVRPEMPALNHFGIPKEEVLSTVETAIGGTKAGQLYKGVVRFPIIVRLSSEERSDLNSIRQIPVGAAENLTIPLQDVASIQFEETYGDIRRETSQKRTAVMINIRGRDTESFVKDAQMAVEKNLSLPPGYYVEWGGNFKNLETAKQRLFILVPIALILVFIMIYTAFKSTLQTVLVFASLPMALLGGILGLYVNGLDFSISAAVGFIALSGIAVLNGVVLVSYFNQLKSEGHRGVNLVKAGAMMRLRPVLMTALTDALGFLPMMLSQGMGAEVQRPLASVVVGGILTSSFLTLIFLPIAYLVLEKYMRTDGNIGH